MADPKKIADDLSKLTILEAAELSKMLKDKWDGTGSGHRATLLFEDHKRTRQEPRGHGESLFEFYDGCARHGYDEFRSLVNCWLAKMPAEHRDKLLTRFWYGKNREPWIARPAGRSGWSAVSSRNAPGCFGSGIFLNSSRLCHRGRRSPQKSQG
jgi:hypothetical protein